jgi:hypothetical protein
MHLFFAIIKWLKSHILVTIILSILSVLTFLGTLLIIPVIVIFLPEDYFIKYGHKHNYLFNKHPVLRYFVLIIKNVFGVFFIALGIILLFLPGQGILTIFVGILLIDFPKKKALIIYFVKKEKIHKAINKLRIRYNKPEFIIPE